MAEVANDSANPDITLLRSINDLAKQAPRGVDRAAEFFGEYGLIAVTALLAGWCWWRVARRSADAPAAVAGVLWSCLAAGIALLLNFPVRALVQRPRPYVDHDGLDVLVSGQHGTSFVSDHMALIAAAAVGLFMVSRKAGVIAMGLALVEGFTQVYLGVHYPTDVIGGFALGAATVLLLAPAALALLTALTTAVARTRASFLVRARPTPYGRPPRAASPHRWHSADDKDLAA
ncbi:phosphatase PAP2 family protein [Streptomyces sp. NBC_01477]|uniref:phosphatase PAP2 family protein n=1 Tax=Streptomyces sp. NBC_01477 TaxID=2976015 RepID=UPI002E374F67|nr:phosphatase PAP2 family protein [Streptomyces sp. NBC_01477]